MEYKIFVGVYAILGIASVIGAFKCCDWLISLKYKTKDECAKCRDDIYKLLSGDRDLLTRIDTKVDLIMENFNLKPKNKEKGD